MRWVWRAAIIIIAWLLFESVFSWLATCQPHQGEADYGSKENHCTLFNGPLFLFGAFALRRAWHFLGANEHELVAGFTVVLALSTIGLWISTRKLWVAGERQIDAAGRHFDQQFRLMGTANAAAFITANSARSSAEAAQRTAAAAKEAADNAVASNRPFMFVERIQQYFSGTEAYVHYRIQNVGKSVAMLEEYAVDLRIFEHLPEKPEYVNVHVSRLAISEREIIPEHEGGELAVPHLVAKGPKFIIAKLHKDDVPLLSHKITDEDKFRLYLFGYFKYSDVFGKFRQTGFGYDLSTRPVRIESAAYNYDREIERPEA